MVDESRDASVRVDLQVLGSLVISLHEIKVDWLVRNTEFIEEESNLPV